MDKDTIGKLASKINGIFVGKEEVVRDVLTCLLAGGHVLIEDVPGVGKTTLAKTLAGSTNCSFARIQFTPDTLPGDVTGLSVYNMKTGDFEYKEGAIMHQMVLADEINRTSPKTQASLLEAMAEGCVTVDGITYALPKPFMVIATQNPVEYLGTYPLPEAQTDRFMMRLSVGYPDASEEIRLAKNHIEGKYEESVTSVCSFEDILEAMADVKKVHTGDAVLTYVRDIINATRSERSFVTGASPRAMLALIDAGRARAYIEGRDFVKPDDIKAVAVNVLHHRLKLTGEAKMQNADADGVIRALVLATKIPME